MSKRLLLLAASTALMLAPTIAGAVPIGGTGVLGSFSGSFEYTATDDTTGTVEVVLNNDSLTAGYITAFLFNVPTGADVDSVLFSSSNPNFELLGDDDSFDGGESGSPNGQFDVGATTASGYQGGGTPLVGIPQGGSATFTFVRANSARASSTALRRWAASPVADDSGIWISSRFDPCGRQIRFSVPLGSTRFFSAFMTSSARLLMGRPSGCLISYSRLVPPTMSMPGLRLVFSSKGTFGLNATFFGAATDG